MRRIARQRPCRRRRYCPAAVADGDRIVHTLDFGAPNQIGPQLAQQRQQMMLYPATIGFQGLFRVEGFL